MKSRKYNVGGKGMIHQNFYVRKIRVERSGTLRGGHLIHEGEPLNFFESE